MAKSSASFPKGVTGNPAGRPPNTTPRARFRKMIEPDLPDIVKALVNAAKGGDVQAIKVIYDRIVPSVKPSSEDLSIRVKGSLQERGEAIIAGLTRGAIGPEQALTVLNALAAQSKLVEQSEILDRIAQLEALCLPAKI